MCHSLDKLSIVVPHQIDQPHPTKQNMIVNVCETPTIQLITKLPILPRALSCCEKRGIPKHRQKKPEKIVPTIKLSKNTIIIKYF